ncbi:MAG: class I SAM-dependent methyltransferase [Pyrinomonadaceae bacterium]
MPTLKDNLAIWSKYDWSSKGEEWSVAWGDSKSQWVECIRPRIERFLPVNTILEIGTGHGRWTAYLKNECDRLMGVDLSKNCIQSCQERFSDQPNLSFYLNDGTSLSMVPDDSVDFVFSFDSLVHAEADVIEAYLRQLQKKLKANAAGFIHHSNLGVYRFYYSLKRMLPVGKGILRKHGILDNDGLRAISMSARRFEQIAESASLQCISQEMVNWGSRRLIDCLSLFTPAGSIHGNANKVSQNPNFMQEATRIRMNSLKES